MAALTHLPIALLLVPVAATLAGGLLAVRFWRFRPQLNAVGAGLLLGAAFLDLLPEAFSIGSAVHMRVSTVPALMLLSFLGFFTLEATMDALNERYGLLNEPTAPPSAHPRNRTAGRVAGALLIFHSFRDGLAIGTSFAAGRAAVYTVTLGIAAHDIGDGMNTVLLTTGGERPSMTDYFFLAADSIAPFAGALLSSLFLTSARDSVVLLALAAGFFLQMATSDLLPELRRNRGSRILLFALLCVGVALIYTANLLLGEI